MAQKRKDLAAALPEAGLAAAVGPPPVSNDQTETPKAKSPSSRADMVNVSGWFPKTVKFELEELRLALSRERGRKVTLQEVLAEGLNDLFKKYGRPELAPTKEG